MKKFRGMLLAFACAFLLSGCVKESITLDIKSNGKVNVDAVVAIDKQYESSLGQLDSYVDQGKENGYKVEKYEDDQYIGNTYKKSFKLDDVTTKDDVTYEIANILTDDLTTTKMVKKDGNKYKISFTFETDSSMTGAVYEFKVKLPNKAISHNADSVKGNTYTWNISENPKTIEMEFELKGGNTILFVIIGLVVVAGVVCFVVLKKKKGTPNTPVVANEVAPVNTMVQPTPVTPVAADNTMVQPTPVAPVEQVNPVVQPAPQEQVNQGNNFPGQM